MTSMFKKPWLSQVVYINDKTSDATVYMSPNVHFPIHAFVEVYTMYVT